MSAFFIESLYVFIPRGLLRCSVA